MVLERKPDELWTSYLIRVLEDQQFFIEWRSFGGATVGLSDNREISFKRLSPADLLDDIPHPCTYTQLKEILESLKEEEILIYHGDDNLDFIVEGETRAVMVSCNITEEIFERYRPGESYQAREVIDSILQYALAYRLPLASSPDSKVIPERPRQSAPRERQEEDSLSPKLDEILRTVRRLENIAAEHPVVMKGEGRYLQELYVKAINEDVNNLQFFEYRGKRIPYVLVHSVDLEGHVGRPFHNLYFVARDLAPEDWQQKIVAFHESQCLHFGSHEAAKGKEPRLARFLGKEQEYLQWREQIDNGTLGCQGKEVE